MNDFRDVALSYVLNYFIHSSVLIGAVIAIVRVLKPASNPLRESLWTVALFGGFVTAGLQTAAIRSGVVAESRAVTQGGAAPIAVSDPNPEPAVVHGEPAARAGTFPRVEAKPRTVASDGVAVPAASRSAGVAPPVRSDVRPEHASERAVAPGWRDRALSLLVAGSQRCRTVLATCTNAVRRVSVDVADLAASRVRTALGLAALAGAAWWCVLLLRSRRALAARERITSGPLHDRLEELRIRFGVRKAITLSMSDAVSSPVAFGVSRFEICVPRRASALESDQQEAMLAHEIAHLVRRDPLRLLLARAVECIAFFQPLNRLARRRLFEVVEMRCDAFAVERLGGGLALAGCLAEVASWLCEPADGSFAPAMAESRSTLGRRIECLLDERTVIACEHRQRAAARATFVVLPALALLAPGVAIGSAPPPTAHHATQRDVAESAAPPAVSGDAVDAALAEVMGALDREIASLQFDIANLRLTLGDAGYDAFECQLGVLEERLERMNDKRLSVSTAWQRLRGASGGDADLATDASRLETESALPVLPRRKP